MIEQFAIFTNGGQLIFRYNAFGRKFFEQPLNQFIYELISNPMKQVNDKFATITIESNTFMFYESKQPHLYYVVSYTTVQSLELNQEAEQVLNMSIKLWDSLGLNDVILSNLSGKNKKNRHNYIWILNDGEKTLDKFNEYFCTRYEFMKVVSPSFKQKQQCNIPKKYLSKGEEKKIVKGKATRKWGRDGIIEDMPLEHVSRLDFSESPNEVSNCDLLNIDKSALGNRTKEGEFLINEMDALMSKPRTKPQDTLKKSYLSPFAFLQARFLGNKTIIESDLTKILENFKEKLISKNVAPEVAGYLSNQVVKDLVGVKTENWKSVEDTARESLQKVATNLLTPNVSIDLLHEIQKKCSVSGSDGSKNPYVFSIVGVNGVGKSTSLSKLAFWLLQNDFKVLVVACDTFRSGAVEQLRVHVDNLAQLMDDTYIRGSKNKRGKSGSNFIELFEAGYGGTDLVTKIAKQAIKYARNHAFDVVLIDTAGRRHNDPTLMAPLKSFAEQAKPDKIIMVGEALVGTDSVQQAKNFNQAFGKERNLDFFIVSKCDTVGEMLGTMINVVYATGIPILFIGIGQTYTDLRTLSVKWAVDTLLS